MTPMKSTKPVVQNILTIDVEDWFHICGVQRQLPRSIWDSLEQRVVPNTLYILDLLKKYHVQATFFILGWVARRNPDLVREIASQGHEIASHGYNHQRVYTLDEKQFENDLLRSLDILAPLSKNPIRGYRAPEWSIRGDSLWALEILHRNGLQYDSSMTPLPFIGDPQFPKHIHRRQVPGGDIWQVPPLAGPTPWGNLPLAGGWGLRMFPAAVTRYYIRRCNRSARPAVLYFHPCEMQRSRCNAPVPLLKRFVVSAGIVSSGQRLRHLLQHYKFTNIWNVLRDIKKKVESSCSIH
ncbi:MAG: DUF3473 domain-containing protein [Desulfobacteraceae bacterium]|nr:DUF3473 domain-containing protein [Desulfobacteraceae bacterium]